MKICTILFLMVITIPFAACGAVPGKDDSESSKGTEANGAVEEVGDAGSSSDGDGVPTTLMSSKATAAIPIAENCKGDELGAGGDIDVVNVPLTEGPGSTATITIMQMTIRYKMNTFFGEPTRSGTASWSGSGSIGDITWAAEVLTPDGKRQYVTASGARVWASWILGTIPAPGKGFGFDVTGSPDWKQTFVTHDGSDFAFGVTADEAKAIYRGCFTLGSPQILKINGQRAYKP